MIFSDDDFKRLRSMCPLARVRSILKLASLVELSKSCIFLWNSWLNFCLSCMILLFCSMDWWRSLSIDWRVDISTIFDSMLKVFNLKFSTFFKRSPASLLISLNLNSKSRLGLSFCWTANSSIFLVIFDISLCKEHDVFKVEFESKEFFLHLPGFDSCPRAWIESRAPQSMDLPGIDSCPRAWIDSRAPQYWSRDAEYWLSRDLNNGL